MRHTYNTRNRLQYILPNTRLAKTYNAYYVQGLRFYNLLPLEIREFQSKKFKHILNKILIQSEGYTFEEIETFIVNLDDTTFYF